jgi:hypothetical protein
MRTGNCAWIAVLFLPCLLFWSPAGYPDEPMGQPLGKQIAIKASAPSLNKKTGLSTLRLVLTNRTRNPKLTFLSPLALLVTGVNRPDVTLANGAGQTSAGLAYVSVPVPRAGLKPGKSAKVILRFNNPGRKKFKPSYAVYSGLASAVNFGTNSGAIGVLALPNQRIVFVPSGTGIRPVSVESAGNAKAAASPTPAGASSSVALSFPADACTVDLAALKVICVGFDSTRIAILDVSTYINTLSVADIKVSEFESGAPDTSLSFSGGSCILCGIAADPGDNRYIVAANDGYRVYAYGAGSPSAVYPIPVNENFSYDPSRNRIIAAEYQTASGSATRAFNIVDLNKGKVYRWTKDTSSCADLGSADTGCAAQYQEVDSTAVDLSTGMAAMIFEHSTAVAMIDLGQAAFDDGASSFTAPAFYTDSPSGAQQSGIAASTTGNYLFTSEELGDSHVGALQLPAASGSGGTFPPVTPNAVFIDLSAVPNPECAGSAYNSYSFETKGDPHGLALYTGLIGGKQTGLVIDSSNACAALVDLAGLLATQRDPANSTQVAASVDLKAAGIVRFVNLQ